MRGLTEEERQTRRVTIEALDMSREPNPSNELEKTLARVARRYGEDSIREFVRMTVLREKANTEAATIIFGDGAVGQQLGIAIRHIIHRGK
jgi:hypothetical protein